MEDHTAISPRKTESGEFSNSRSRRLTRGIPQSGHHSMMGSTDDPNDGKAVAASVFVAVAVYAVCPFHSSPLPLPFHVFRGMLLFAG